MIIEFEEKLFSAQYTAQHAEVLRALLSACPGRHMIVLQTRSSIFETWIASLPGTLANDVVVSIQAHARMVSRSAGLRRIIVTDLDSESWEIHPPRVSVTSALQLMSEPFRIWVEDFEADRAFFLAFSTEQQQRFVERLEASHALAFAHGGGLGSMLRQLQKRCENQKQPGLNCAVIIDSDAWHPGNPSDASERVRILCAENGIHCLQLNRRAIENYITKEALNAWTYKQGRQIRLQHEAAFLAYCRLNRDQGAHYNMKDGFAQDRRSPQRSSAGLYAAVALPVLSQLEDGFGSKVGECYGRRWVSETAARREGIWPEIVADVDHIYRLIS